MKKSDEVAIKEIRIIGDFVVVSYRGSEQVEAWLENKNKHEPEILCLAVDRAHKNITIDGKALRDFVERANGDQFRLSLCTPRRRIPYRISEGVESKYIHGIGIVAEDGEICVCAYKNFYKRSAIHKRNTQIEHQNCSTFEAIKQLPVDILNIGSCFSRSIFKSDAYFNPTYKQYFHVKRTLFHNSFISLFSDAADYDYRAIEDLTTGDAALYAGVEFEKNIEQILSETGIQVVVADNYVDAACPIIRFGENCYLTYNKYLSESIFKRFFASCEVICPGSEEHLALYRNSIVEFRKKLQAYGIKNVVLIGGRLNESKIDEQSGHTERWDGKMDWINATNENWDAVDRIFLEEIPNAIYIDKRKTCWKNDVHSPIIGGASPSHYQSGYYKELFNDLIKFFEKELFHET